VFFEWRCEIHVLYLIFLQKLFAQAVVGCIVLTDYNNETYRVDDVNFDVSPRSTFEIRRKGSVSKISYVDYYLQVSCVFLARPSLDFCP
jgi:aubergine-like protein